MRVSVLSARPSWSIIKCSSHALDFIARPFTSATTILITARFIRATSRARRESCYLRARLRVSRRIDIKIRGITTWNYFALRQRPPTDAHRVVKRIQDGRTWPFSVEIKLRARNFLVHWLRLLKIAAIWCWLWRHRVVILSIVTIRMPPSRDLNADIPSPRIAKIKKSPLAGVVFNRTLRVTAQLRAIKSAVYRDRGARSRLGVYTRIHVYVCTPTTHF